MANTLPAYLPLSDDMALLLQVIHRDGVIPPWASKTLLGRARNLNLLSRNANGLTITKTGEAAAVITEQHAYSIGYAHSGRLGTSGRCRCRDWEFSTNENGRDGKRLVRNAFAAHLANMINEYLAESY